MASKIKNKRISCKNHRQPPQLHPSRPNSSCFFDCIDHHLIHNTCKRHLHSYNSLAAILLSLLLYQDSMTTLFIKPVQKRPRRRLMMPKVRADGQRHREFRCHNKFTSSTSGSFAPFIIAFSILH